MATGMAHRSSYMPSLDGVRGLAVLMVLLLHSHYGIFKGGWIGVDLFFALSGFLITSLLYQEYRTFGRISLVKFYARRALRLFAPLFIGVALANVLWNHTQNPPDADRSIATLGSLFYLANVVQQDILGSLTHLWSLAVEEHFYLFWPAIATMLFVLPIKKIVISICVFIAITEVARVAAYHFDTATTVRYGIFALSPSRFTLLRMNTILMGAIVAMLVQTGRLKKAASSRDHLLIGGLALVFLGVLFSVSEGGTFLRSGGFVATDVLCAATVMIAARNGTHVWLSDPRLTWIGRRSYGIYVYHYPIFMAFATLRVEGDTSNLVVIAVLRVVTSFVVAAVSFRFIEAPLMQWKKRFEVSTVT